jgi:prepilin-type processing-associated H-X9-DG protein
VPRIGRHAIKTDRAAYRLFMAMRAQAFAIVRSRTCAGSFAEDIPNIAGHRGGAQIWLADGQVAV